MRERNIKFVGRKHFVDVRKKLYAVGKHKNERMEESRASSGRTEEKVQQYVASVSTGKSKPDV